MIIREALLRERYRGGQASMSCRESRIWPRSEGFLREQVPEVKVAWLTARCRRRTGRRDDGLLRRPVRCAALSTTIVESGLDIPTANTLIVHRADMFGLAQLYQLRGRVGRSKVRAYALLRFRRRGS